MALNPSGAISLGGPISGESINLENAQPATATVSLNDAAVRSLAGPAFATPATQIQMPTDFYGKSNLFTFTLAAGTDVNLRSAAISAGWPGSGAVQANINPGTTIQSSSTGGYALTINGAWPGGVTVVNSGTIVGRGGAGGTAVPGVGVPGGSGGTAILVSVPVTINNASGTISGGGGGGGAGGPRSTRGGNFGGGGGGGGNGFGTQGSGQPAGFSGAPGAPGGLLNGGGGGGGGSSFTFAGSGGSGGSNANSGNPGSGSDNVGGGGGGGGGNALSGNPLVTFPSLGTIYGPRV